MTNGKFWTDERLSQLAADIEGNKIAIAELRASTADTRAAAESLLQIAQIHQTDIEAIGRDMQGLKLEVRRLVEELRQQREE